MDTLTRLRIMVVAESEAGQWIVKQRGWNDEDGGLEDTWSEWLPTRYYNQDFNFSGRIDGPLAEMDMNVLLKKVLGKIDAYREQVAQENSSG